MLGIDGHVFIAQYSERQRSHGTNRCRIFMCPCRSRTPWTGIIGHCHFSIGAVSFSTATIVLVVFTDGTGVCDLGWYAAAFGTFTKPSRQNYFIGKKCPSQRHPACKHTVRWFQSGYRGVVGHLGKPRGVGTGGRVTVWLSFTQERNQKNTTTMVFLRLQRWSVATSLGLKVK